MPIEVKTPEDFSGAIGEKQPTTVQFLAPRCGGCKMVTPQGDAADGERVPGRQAPKVRQGRFTTDQYTSRAGLAALDPKVDTSPQGSSEAAVVASVLGSDNPSEYTFISIVSHFDTRPRREGDIHGPPRIPLGRSLGPVVSRGTLQSVPLTGSSHRLADVRVRHTAWHGVEGIRKPIELAENPRTALQIAYSIRGTTKLFPYAGFVRIGKNGKIRKFPY
ncbi:hypothetical protein ON010_g3258 [Phytophthora cinnamomi]|nr:hypothetical protein ON010_g3258 [Phytophthora cinnamomi]